MKPMFSYMGSKYRLAKLYGPPQTNLVIEPFAGSACYSLYWNAPNVILYDVNPVIAGIWNYLIRVKESEFKKLPINFKTTTDLKIPQEAKWLIGFWLSKGTVSPSFKKTKWSRQYQNSGHCQVWSEPTKLRILSQLHLIKNWKIFNRDYATINNEKADWFIDPPYEICNKKYTFSEINHRHLALWCKSRWGRITVCENNAAKWLPFKKLKITNSCSYRLTKKAIYNQELIYQKEIKSWT